jgi:hypothetical protein
MQFRLLDILQSTGPVALDELIMRTHPGQSPEDLQELVEQLKALVNEGIVNVSGLRSADLSKMTAEDLTNSSDAIVQVSRAGLRRALAS